MIKATPYDIGPDSRVDGIVSDSFRIVYLIRLYQRVRARRIFVIRFYIVTVWLASYPNPNRLGWGKLGPNFFYTYTYKHDDVFVPCVVSYTAKCVLLRIM